MWAITFNGTVFLAGRELFSVADPAVFQFRGVRDQPLGLRGPSRKPSVEVRQIIGEADAVVRDTGNALHEAQWSTFREHADESAAGTYILTHAAQLATVASLLFRVLSPTGTQLASLSLQRASVEASSIQLGSMTRHDYRISGTLNSTT